MPGGLRTTWPPSADLTEIPSGRAGCSQGDVDGVLRLVLVAPSHGAPQVREGCRMGRCRRARCPLEQPHSAA